MKRILPIIIFNFCAAGCFLFAQNPFQQYTFYPLDSLAGFDFQQCWSNAVEKNILTKDIPGYFKKEQKKFLQQKYPYQYPSNSNTTKKHTLPTPQASCTNMGFESGSFSGWTGYSGNNNDSQLPLSNLTPGLVPSPGGAVNQPAGTCGNRHTLVDASLGTDGCGGFSVVSPLTGSYSAMLNDNCSGDQGSVLEQTFTVSNLNTMLTIAYAVVLEDGGHTQNEQPYFRAEVLDQNGNPINCLVYTIIAQNGSTPGFFQSTTCGIDYYYKPWTTSSFNVAGYVGQNITVRFTVSNCSQMGHYGYAYVDAMCGPMAMLSSSPAVCGTNQVTLTAPPGAQSYQWSTVNGLGNIVGTTTNQTVIINQGGHYQVTVTPTTGAACAYTLDSIIPGIPTAPVANFQATTVCQGQPTLFTDNSTPLGLLTSWDWDFNNNGSSDDNTQNPSHTFPNSGTIPVKLTVSASGGLCVKDTVISVTVNSGPNIQANNNGPFCAGTTVQLTANGGVSYQWTGPNGFTSTNQNDSIVNPTLASSGNYTVVGTNASGCSTSDVTSVSISSSNFATASNDPGTYCEGETVTLNSSGGVSYSWTGPSGYTSAQQNATITGVLQTQAGTFSVVVTDANGCQGVATTNISVMPAPTAQFTASDVCIGTPVQFTNTSTTGTSSAWTFGDGNASIQNNPSHNYNSAGNQTVSLTVTDPAGCSNTATQQVLVHDNPTVTFTSDKISGCPELCVNFLNTSSVNYGDQVASQTWLFENGETSTLPNPAICFDSTGFYNVSLSVVSDAGCSSSSTINNYIQVYPVPVADFNANPNNTSILTPLITFINKSDNISGFTWYFGDGKTENTEENPTHEYSETGTYYASLVVINENGCKDSTSRRIQINPDWILYAPNTFTPNGDGINDEFRFSNYGVKEAEYFIYDRWGILIFKSNDINTAWNGKVQGKSDLAQVDVYICKLRFTDVFGRAHSQVLDINLIR
ncbi:MAG: PKD domain-containing protein [Bacteroidetes bacterium]|nr:PKD domain-containing protein [Bacteroidota bacterium]